MKPLILTLSGVALLTTVTWGQMLPSHLPSQFTTTGISGSVVATGETVDLNGPWYQTSTFDYGANYRGGYYTNSAGHNLNVIMQNGSTLIVNISKPDPNSPYGGSLWGAGFRSVNGTWWAGLTNRPPDYGSPSLILTPSNSLSASNFANGITAEGYLVGGPAPEGWGAPQGGSSVIVEQAEQLNVGLSFDNGQWVPTQ